MGWLRSVGRKAEHAWHGIGKGYNWVKEHAGNIGKAVNAVNDFSKDMSLGGAVNAAENAGVDVSGVRKTATEVGTGLLNAHNAGTTLYGAAGRIGTGISNVAGRLLGRG